MSTLSLSTASIAPVTNKTDRKRLVMLALLTTVILMFAAGAFAAGNTGTALQAAYDSLNDLAGGYGKQILTLMGFVIAAVGYLGANSSSAVFKFVGYAIFLGAGLGGAVTLAGSVI